MSTAIMPRYDFGDNIIKSTMSNRDAAPGAHLDLGASGMRITLTRMASTPSTTSNTNGTNGLTNAQNITFLLGNLTQQHRRLERTQSAPAPPVSTPVSATAVVSTNAASVNTSRYKTELCRPYEEFGVCKYGDKCQFAHGGAELRSLARHPKYKTELCRTYHTVGFCPYGPRCHFVHNQDEVLQKAPLIAMRSSPPAVNAAAAAAAVAAAAARSRPAALSPALSLDSPSPPCSLSQSPTSSMGSFFSSEPELHSPTATIAGTGGVNSTTGGLMMDDQRLPVFNRLSQVQIFSLSDLVR